MGWAVLQCEPTRESLVRIQLMRQNFDTYAPRIRLRHGKVARLFPNYVFVRADERWCALMWTAGVSRVLMSAGVPAQLDEAVIAEIRSREGRDGFIKIAHQRARHGQRMRVVGGSFAGCVGWYEAATSADRERILLEVLGQRVRVEMPVRLVEPIYATDCVSG